MSRQIRETYTAQTSGGKLKDAPYKARVVGHLDPSFMGRIKVTLLNLQGNPLADDNSVYYAKYLSTFGGTTAFEYNGNNLDSYRDTQKSFGMTFSPPDIGNTVIVIFLNGNRNECYYIGQEQTVHMNNMIPGIPVSEFFEATPEQKNSDLPRIFLATPVHSECSIHYTQSLLTLQQECLKRNNSRDRVIKEDIFEFVWNSIEKNPPQLEEGFYDIITVSE